MFTKELALEYNKRIKKFIDDHNQNNFKESIWRGNAPECQPGASAPDSGCEASKIEITRKAVK